MDRPGFLKREASQRTANLAPTGPEMNQLTIVEPEALARAEFVYRQHLAHEPDDAVARLSLAWCLFMQALHQAGRESALAGTPRDERGGEEFPLQPVVNVQARQVLLDCLRQTTAVTHLSRRAQDHRDVEKLRALVRLCNGDAVMSEAEAEAVQILEQLARETSQIPRGSRLQRLAGGPRDSGG
jgi:hypothetical protein